MAAKKSEESSPKYHIEGGVHAGRDVILGDQYNQIVQQVQNNPSPAEFTAALKQVQAELAALKQQPALSAVQAQVVQIAVEKVQAASDVASQPEPQVNELKAALTDAKESVQLISGSLLAAVQLGALIGELIVLAGRVFGVF